MSDFLEQVENRKVQSGLDFYFERGFKKGFEQAFRESAKEMIDRLVCRGLLTSDQAAREMQLLEQDLPQKTEAAYRRTMQSV